MYTPGVWKRLRPHEAASLGRFLVDSGVHLYQQPYWNDAYAAPGICAEHFVHTSDDGRPTSHVAVLRFGAGPLAVGIARCGPTDLDARMPLTGPRLESLFAFLSKRYVSIRWSFLDDVQRHAALQDSRASTADAFPFLAPYSYELQVPLLNDEGKQMAALSRSLRYDIRKAGDLGYEVTQTNDPELLKDRWPLTRGNVTAQGVQGVWTIPRQLLEAGQSRTRPELPERICSAQKRQHRPIRIAGL